MTKELRGGETSVLADFILRNSLREIVIASQPDKRHGLPHLDLAWMYAESLWELYGQNLPKRLTLASVYLHDISEPGYKASSEKLRRQKSADLAFKLLDVWKWPSEQIEIVTQAILDHDQPGLIPRTVVGKILKDSDVLAGLGSAGLIRLITKMTEKGEGVDYVMEALQKRMPQRMQGLCFPESIKIAEAKWELVSEFLKDLKKEGVMSIKEAREKLGDSSVHSQS